MVVHIDVFMFTDRVGLCFDNNMFTLVVICVIDLDPSLTFNVLLNSFEWVVHEFRPRGMIFKGLYSKPDTPF